jgi:hypothetical protein
MGQTEERRYRELLKPMWAAAIRLALTPAPDFADQICDRFHQHEVHAPDPLKQHG